MIEGPCRPTLARYDNERAVREPCHEHSQDDLICLARMVRVAVLDQATGETLGEDIGGEYVVEKEYDADDSDKHRVPWTDPRVGPTVSVRDTP
jgi:hypothetical protein